MSGSILFSIFNNNNYHYRTYSASSTRDEAEVDAHVHEALRMEDPDILLDLRHTNWK